MSSLFLLVCSAQEESVVEPKFRQRGEEGQGVQAGILVDSCPADGQIDVVPIVGRGRRRERSSRSETPWPTVDQVQHGS